MFNESEIPVREEWLVALSETTLDGNDLWGRLVVKNLQEDLNCPQGRRDAFRGALDQKLPLPDRTRARDTMWKVIEEINSQGFTFTSPSNAACALGPSPFPSLVRVMDIGNFAQWNFYGVDTSRFGDASYPAQIASRIKAGSIDPTMLTGEVGAPTGVWATDREQVLRDDGTFVEHPDQVRNRLGLDDPERFRAGENLVVLSYEAACVPVPVYRPTVLDTGGAMAAAWMPSEPATDPTGFTQHLTYGGRGSPEILHRPFPATEVTSVKLHGPLQGPPSTEYRALRLGMSV